MKIEGESMLEFPDRPASGRFRSGLVKYLLLGLTALPWTGAAAHRAPARIAARRSTHPARIAARGAEIVAPPVRYSDTRLANGLRVLMVEDHTAPTVAIAIGYHVGGKDDPPGRSGFAHLFEHLMFKGTANTAPETMDRLTEDVGGWNNAFTIEDATVFHEVVPSNYLETLLWAEADRLKSLNVDLANFKTEREVVIGEYGQDILASPYGMLGVLTDAKSYTVHPYRRGVIGSPAELNAATLDDVRRFHSTYYRPDNAVLAIVGDFSPRQAGAWVTQYFGRIPKPGAPIPRVTVVEPAQRAGRRVVYSQPNVPLPAVEYVYHACAESSPDAPALTIAADILSNGQSSRLYRTFVYEKQIASDASAGADLREQPGLFTFTVTLNAGKRVADAERLLDDEIRKIRTTPVSAAELDKAKTQELTGIVRRRESDMDRALDLVLTTIEQGDPRRLNTEPAELNAVTAGDVLRVMRRYIRPENRTVIEYLPARKRS